MKCNCSDERVTQVEADAVVVGVYAESPPAGPAAEIDEAIGGVIAQLIEREEITGKKNETLTLYADARFPDRTRLERWPEGTGPIELIHPGGAESLVYEGVLEDEEGRHPAPSWLRIPEATAHRAWSDEGCRLYLKTGALATLRQEQEEGA